MAEPRWLDAGEQRVWRVYLEFTQMLFDALDRQLQHDTGLSHADYEVLVRLSEAEGRRLRMSLLADSAMFSRSRLSHAISRLERDGWVRRESCSNDRRGTFAVLTDAGFAALEAAAPGHVETVRRLLFDALSEQQVGELGAIGDAIRDQLFGALGRTPMAPPAGLPQPEREERSA